MLNSVRDGGAEGVYYASTVSDVMSDTESYGASGADSVWDGMSPRVLGEAGDLQLVCLRLTFKPFPCWEDSASWA